MGADGGVRADEAAVARRIGSPPCRTGVSIQAQVLARGVYAATTAWPARARLAGFSTVDGHPVTGRRHSLGLNCHADARESTWLALQKRNELLPYEAA